jgi:uncharacterized protein
VSRAFDRAVGWIVDRPWLVLALVLSMTGLATLGYVAPETLSRLVSSEPGEAPLQDYTVADDEPYEAPPDVQVVSLTNANAIIVVQSDAMFTPDGARALRHIVRSLEDLPYVDHILWMDEIPDLNIFGLPEPLFPRAQASAERFAAAREKAMQHPLVGGQLVSLDGKTLLLLVYFDFLFITSDDDCTTGLRTAAEQAAAEFPQVGLSFQVTGHVPMFLTAVEAHEANQTKYQVIGYAVIAVMSAILFRGITAVIVVGLAPALGVFWTLGLLRFFDFQDNPFNDVILPVLLSLVGLTDGVHLMVQIRRLRAAGVSGRESARIGLQKVGLACFLTSLTTAIGLGSLMLAHHDVVKEFGMCCVIGVLVMFLAVITVIPLACMTWLGNRVHVGHERGLIDRNLMRIGGLVDLVLAYPKRMSAIGLALTLVCILISLSLRPDQRVSNDLPTGSEAAQAMQHLDAALGGLEFSQVSVRWSSKIAGDSAEVMEVVTQVDDLLRAEALIGRPLSIRSFVDALPGEGKATERMSMMELLPPPLKRAFYTPELRRATVSFRVQDLGIAAYGPVFRRVEAGLESITRQHPEFVLEMEGSAVWRWKNLYRIVVDLAASLGTAMVVIFFVMALAYRSLRIGLIAMMPNVFPLAVTGTFLVFAGQSLELVTVCAFTICLGIAVDDTIHFLTRFQEEQVGAANNQEAIRRAFTAVGTALIMTTVVLIAGFSTVLFSDSRDHRIFAWMGGLTLSAALLGDLLFLPALVLCFVKPRQVKDG